MTSSLVGSEMCIRDRAQGAEEVRQLDKRHGEDCGQQQELQQSEHVLIITVSYTHLTLPTICSV
eukprot:12621314-Prorocentrum_lima.AAC.1